ncbi:hypothetical protein ACSQ67_017767 [Phaseolus vulgaris]
MENEREEEIEDMSMSPPSLGSMQFAGSNGFGHSMEFMSQAYLPNMYTEIDIKIEDSTFNQDPPSPFISRILVLPAMHLEGLDDFPLTDFNLSEYHH